MLYPTMVIAAIAVILFSVAGIAAMAGLWPLAPAQGDLPDKPRPRLTAPSGAPRALDAPAVATRPGVAHEACEECGVVESVRPLQRDSASPVAGRAGISEGVRAVSGASAPVTYRVRVRMGDGTYRMFYQPTEPTVSPGQRVRVEDGRMKAERHG